MRKRGSDFKYGFMVHRKHRILAVIARLAALKSADRGGPTRRWVDLGLGLGVDVRAASRPLPFERPHRGPRFRNADHPERDAVWVDEVDEAASPTRGKGIGEIGVVGVAPAVANAVFHATELQIREVPILPLRLLAEN